MELIAEEFKEMATEALDSSLPVVGTIFAGKHPFCDNIKSRRDVKVIEVTRENRDSLPKEIINNLALNNL